MPLDKHINKPLRRHVWASKGRAWTRAALDRERADFFDTRVTGRPEVWQSLRTALEVLWDPVAQGAAADGTDGLATAQGILDAAEITLPTGDLAQGAYDQLGNYYPLSEWLVADPTNLVEDDVTVADEALSTADLKDDLAGGDETTEDLDEDDNLRRREEKGKAVVDARDQLSVLARLSETARDVTVSFLKSDTVRVVARKIQEESGVSRPVATPPPLFVFHLTKVPARHRQKGPYCLHGQDSQGEPLPRRTGLAGGSCSKRPRLRPIASSGTVSDDSMRALVVCQPPRRQDSHQIQPP